jgi:hypothetical protein
MPESKKDQQLRVRTEVVNYVECGDARGPAWLAKHPADLDRAAQLLASRKAQPTANPLE